jgi:acetylornithine/N-succinyldiaminopimelate aminotransferase
MGVRLRHGIAELQHPLVAEVRGAGLLLGIALTVPAADAAVRALRDAGFLANPVRPDVIRLAPPLIITSAQVRAFLAALPAALDAAHATPARPPGPAAGTPTTPTPAEVRS